MKRLFAILLLATAGLFAACNDTTVTPGAPDVTTAPEVVPTAMPSDAASPSPTVVP